MGEKIRVRRCAAPCEGRECLSCCGQEVSALHREESMAYWEQDRPRCCREQKWNGNCGLRCQGWRGRYGKETGEK